MMAQGRGFPRFRLELSPVTRKVAGSNPVSPAIIAYGSQNPVSPPCTEAPRMSFRVLLANDQAPHRAGTAKGSASFPLHPMFRSTSQRASASTAIGAVSYNSFASRRPRATLPKTLESWDRRFQEFCEYAVTALGHSAASLHGYRHAYRDFRRYVDESGARLPDGFFDVEGWVRRNRRRSLGPVTVNTYWRQLRPFFHDLERLEGIENPFRHMKPPGLPTRMAKAYKPGDCRQILLAAEHYPWPSPFHRARAVAILATFLYAGLRRGELLRLNYNDVSLEDGTIRILRGKGRGGGKDRTAYIAPELRHILEDYLRERRRRNIVGPGFFSSDRTGQGISLSTLRRIHAAIRMASRVPFSLHGLRHSFVTALLRSGVPIHIARDLAGHSSIATTAGYLRVWDEDKRDQIRKVSFR